MQIWDSKSGVPQKVDTGESLIKRAHELHLQDRFDEAEKIYCQLLEQNHNHAAIMATLGSLYMQTGKWGLGIHFLENAFERGCKEPDAYTNLAICYQRSGQHEIARRYYEKSMEGTPTPAAMTNYSGLFIESPEVEKGIELCERAIAEDPTIPTAHWNLALALLAEGRWERAWDEREWGLKPRGLREDRKVVDVPWWDGTQGKTVLVYGEEGLGDEIMFASMLPDLLKTNNVVLECHKRLTTLFKKSFPNIPVYGTREDREVNWAGNHQIDYRIAIGSLGKFFRRTKDSFSGTPYLKADSLPRQDKKFRVGISWKGGGAKLGRVQKRSIPLSWWKPILSIPDIEFVSVQYSDESEELDVMDALGFPIKRMNEYALAEDLYETAKLVKSCDLVVSVCNSVIHLSGALGVKCWCLTPQYPAWRYQNRGPMPWYRSVRLYRSPCPEQEGWDVVIARLAEDLKALLDPKVRAVA